MSEDQTRLGRRALLTGGMSGVVPAINAEAAASIWDSEADVVVVGSGAAACAAALFAAETGAKVLMLEKAATMGGTTALSQARYWIPNNPVMKARGLVDERADFLRFVARCAFPARYTPDSEQLGATDAFLDQMRAFYENGPTMVAELERLGVTGSEIADFDHERGEGLYDYFAHVSENKRPWGRSLTPASPASSTPGADLIERFSKALRARNVVVEVNQRVTRVEKSAGRVVGVTAVSGDKARRIGARRGVIFATGGFLHDTQKRLSLHVNPIFGVHAAPSTTGDFLPIATSVHAQFANYNSALCAPGAVRSVSGGQVAPAETCAFPADSGLLVNRHGKRCVNERGSPHDIVRTMYRWDENWGNFPDQALIYIYDERAAKAFADIAPIPAHRNSSVAVQAATIEQLAAKIADEVKALSAQLGPFSLAPDFAGQLIETVSQFNAMARAGKDEQFRRGDAQAEQFQQRQINRRAAKARGKAVVTGVNICLHPLAGKGPYYAIVVAPFAIDSNGGPIVSTDGKVLDDLGEPIPGLYAAGSCVASPARNAFWGPGTMLGLALTFGMIAGREAAKAAVVQ